MNGIVEMVRSTSTLNARDRFSCSRANWELLQELGLACGWEQQGTTYLAPSSLKMEAELLARHNYQPGDPLDYKRVDSEDALAWAGALGRAKRSAEFGAIIADCWTRR